MHTFALQGSPRLENNTNTLLDAVLSEIKPHHLVVKHHVSLLHIRPCTSCYACASRGHCPVADDMQGLYPALASAPVVILASPIYFHGVTAQLKTVIDRCQTFWTNPASRTAGRVGALLLTAGATDKSGHGREAATSTARIFFDSIGAPLTHIIAVVNTDHQPTATQIELLDKARELGKKLAQN
ncbi:MAG: NADPH-dependent FMN reductase [Bacillota bacterium]|nr:MAG: NADPH-dependent FMN reductase [Bacillota bacterium]MBS3950384.1 flavodoxin family protein [Peptococcaceae bacterium]